MHTALSRLHGNQNMSSAMEGAGLWVAPREVTWSESTVESRRGRVFTNKLTRENSHDSLLQTGSEVLRNWVGTKSPPTFQEVQKHRPSAEDRNIPVIPKTKMQKKRKSGSSGVAAS